MNEKDANTKVLNSCTLLMQAFSFAKSGDSVTAGKLLVKAAEDDGLDSVMDGVAMAANSMEDGSDDTEDNYEDLPNGMDDDSDDEAWEDDDPSTDDDFHEGDEDEDDTPEPTPPAQPMTASCKVTLPASVARLASRTLV